jgi:hypothetical protein
VSTQFFKGHGWFNGQVIEFDSTDGYYQVLYEDNDKEDLVESEIKDILVEPMDSRPEKDDTDFDQSCV